MRLDPAVRLRDSLVKIVVLTFLRRCQRLQVSTWYQGILIIPRWNFYRLENTGKIRWLSPVCTYHFLFLVGCSHLVSFIDHHRGLLNTGGLYGERSGWHLPGFPDTEWAKRNLSQGLPQDAAGVGFFRTEFTLDIPTGWDVMMSFEFEDPAEGQAYRALLFVNGWHMGKRVANLG